MEKEILQSAIEITSHRDLDSLECSLVATIYELLPATAVSIYKLLHEQVKDGFEEAVSLTIVNDDKGGEKLVWDTLSSCLTLDKHVEQCLLDEQAVSYRLDELHYRLLIPITTGKQPLGVIRIDSLSHLDTHQASIEGLIKIYENYLAILNESERDKLTGLLNRRTFEKKLGRLLKSQKNHLDEQAAKEKKGERRKMSLKSNAWLALIDIDHFKRVNDTYGHLFGDEVLLRLAQLMRENFRTNDLLFRFGGEEFLIILEPTPFDSALHILEKFRKTMETYEFPQLGSVTISIGFEVITAADFPETILECADKALYHAKEHGRNRIFNYSQLIADGSLKKQEIDSDIDIFYS